MANEALAWLLDQTCTVRNVGETLVDGITTNAATSTSTGVSCHIQAMTPGERQEIWGTEEVGDYQGFFSSTVGLDNNYLITADSGPYSGKQFWVRARIETDINGIEHELANLEYTEST